MEQQRPSIGRIVHYHALSSDGPVVTHPAVVTRVHSDRCVNLTILFDGGAPEPRTSVERATESDVAGRWSWPPRA